MENSSRHQGWITNLNVYRLVEILLIVANITLLTIWWIKTPPGLLGKADAAGYTVCHRIESRSFFIGDRQTPLCARCSGMFLGALLGILYMARFGKKAGMPPLRFLLAFGFFLIAFALDGVNSYLHLFPNSPGLYEPQNYLRLITGTGVGLGIAAVLVPVFNQVVWREFQPQSAIGTWQSFLSLLTLAGLLDLAVLSENALVLYPLALLSGFAIILILTMVYTIVWVTITKQENRFDQLTGLRVAALAGLFTAMMQIAVLGAGRFWLTGTWAGFQF